MNCFDSNNLDESTFISQCDLSGISEVASTISKALEQSFAPFVLWMDAPMGAGKTTLTSEILQKLGLSPSHPVLSPTYTYINEYKIGDDYYAHIDLYRISSHATLDDLGIDYKTYKGFIIEWPTDNLDLFDLSPTHILSIRYTKDPNQRRYYLKMI